MAEPEQSQQNEPDKTSEQEETKPDTETAQETGRPDADSPDDTEDPETDKAVDDITRAEGDDELKTQDEAAGKTAGPKQGAGGRFKQVWHAWWHSPAKRWGTVAAVVIIIAALFAVPLTRYNILGAVLRTSVTVQTVDSQTSAPVSSAKVELSGKTAETEADGKATLRVKLGSGVLKVSKKYYGTYSHGELVKTGANTFKVKLTALGRQVKIKVVNKITGKPISGAKVTAGGASAKTDKSGLATVVLPSGSAMQAATVSLNGYNNAKVTVDAAGDLAKDTFSITPSGKLYFLSNLSGTIDVVKTNLDGTDRQTVLAGTGNEDPQSTSLLASRDWKYLALLSKRSGDNASVYLIDTTNGDKFTTIDEGDANFRLIGWSGDRFVYEVDRSPSVQNWQPNQEALKSFDPTTGHTLLLDQTQVSSGAASYSYARQYFGNFYLMAGNVVYTKSWQTQGYGTLDGKSTELDSIGADGSGHKVVKSFSNDGSYTAANPNAILYEPDGLYIQLYSYTGNPSVEHTEYYEYNNGSVTTDDTLTDDNFYATPYSTYLLSPSGDQTSWAAQRDGKNTLFTGDDDAKDPKQVASLSDYNPYGWYTDNYLLVSKNSSELYIMPASGGTPLKVSDYYKPAVNYQGYGGGYGGL
ncbi:MAG TPA: hypothetical protein VGM08_01230 [Candidatus Saccharimonadales bacterium]|jgi:hypothetical protein